MTLNAYSRINEVHIEITNMCNLNCDYCYAETMLPAKDYSSRLFTNELFRKTIDRLFEQSVSPTMDVVFHGGEPLLHAPGWFDEACTYARRRATETGKLVAFSMQSNLTLLKPEHVDVFLRHKVDIGVSIDGDREVHNLVRGQFDRTMKAVESLQAVGLLSGVIVVVSHHNYNRLAGVFALLRRFGIRRFHLNIASSVGRGDVVPRLGSDRTFEAWRTCVEEMLACQGELVDSRLIRKIAHFVAPPIDTAETFRQLRCDNAFCHAGVTMVAVQADGKVYPCGCAGSSGTMKTFAFDTMHASEQVSTNDHLAALRRFHAKKEKYYNECQTCPARFVCEHGCPAFDHTDPVTPENTCGATKMLYQYLTEVPRQALVDLLAKCEPTMSFT